MAIGDGRSGWKLCCLGWLLVGIIGSARAASLDDCRAARRGAPADAVAVCTAALDAAAGADAAFELRMHLVELFTAKGELDAAASQLDAAEATLVRVKDPLATHRIARRL